MPSLESVFATVFAVLLASSQAKDLSYNGLAITPQMGWVSESLSGSRFNLLSALLAGQLERLCL